MEIKIINSKADRESYRELCRYCFTDDGGWTKTMLDPEDDTETAYGAFEGKQLKTAIISKQYTVNLFGTEQQMCGISAVASWPEARNQGYVRQIMQTILRAEKALGKTVSALYPFSFRYYAKFGYGDIGATHQVSFSPEEIRLPGKPQAMIAWDGSSKMHKELKSLHNSYYRDFDFACPQTTHSIKDINERLSGKKNYLYLSRRGSEARGVLEYSVQALTSYSSALTIQALAWNSPEALLDIFGHLASHRGQCEKIQGQLHPSVPLWTLTAEPRIEISLSRNWMARPLDIKTLLEARLDEIQAPFPEFCFSVNDPVLPEESGSYRISPKAVMREDFQAEHELPYPVLSSLLFGGISVDQLCGSMPGVSWLKDASAFFKKDRQNYLNERF